MVESPEYNVTILPLGRTVQVPAGSRFVEIARKLGLAIDLPCGGEGICGKCRVFVRSGAASPSPADRRHLSETELGQGVRLACQLTVSGDLTIEIPKTLLLRTSHQILTDTGRVLLKKGTPLVSKKVITLSGGPTADSVVQLIQQALPGVEIPFCVLQDISQQQFELPTTLAAVLAENRLLACEEATMRSQLYGVAVDLGTTTLAASLLDITNGAELGVVGRLNTQTEYGDDVISRIQFACENPWGTQRLQQAVVSAINEMIEELVLTAGVKRESIYHVVAAGNTTMQHLFCGLSPFHLGRFPFRPTTAADLRFFADEIGLKVHPRGQVYVFPAIGGFVGGDTVAGILTTRLNEGRSPALYIDLGTNGEIVLWDGRTLRAAATAAGPAFEGARIHSGMRATEGAIERVWLDTTTEKLCWQVIGGVKPLGLCGSGILDVLALLRQWGIVTPEGRFQTKASIGQTLPDDLVERIIENEGAPAFVVARESETNSHQLVVLTQRDVRQLQLAIGAIRAGTELLLRSAQLAPEDLEVIYLAGGFGNYVRRRNAQSVGLLPREVCTGRIQFCGNTSLLGAKMVLLSRELTQAAREVSRTVEHIDLASQPDFRWKFAEAMIFPECEKPTADTDR
ncbi:MAG: ASKHA domain-containing protein [Thermogutta sp.]